MQISKILRGKIVILILTLLFALFFSLFINFTVREGNTPGPTPAPTTRAPLGPTPASTTRAPAPLRTVAGPNNKCTTTTNGFKIIGGPNDQCYKDWYGAIQNKNNLKNGVACVNDIVRFPTDDICKEFKNGNTECKPKTLGGGVTVCSSG